jgi:hypothetical protein
LGHLMRGRLSSNTTSRVRGEAHIGQYWYLKEGITVSG